MPWVQMLIQMAVKFPKLLKYVPLAIRCYPMFVRFMDELMCAVRNQCAIDSRDKLPKNIVKGRVKFAKNTGDLINFVDSLRGLMGR